MSSPEDLHKLPRSVEALRDCAVGGQKACSASIVCRRVTSPTTPATQQQEREGEEARMGEVEKWAGSYRGLALVRDHLHGSMAIDLESRREGL